MSYIAEVQIDSGSMLPVGSSLYGICSVTAGAYEKTVALSNFDTLINGVTVHVKFTNGNSAPLINPLNNSENLTLKVGTTLAQQISNPGGNINWSSGAVISFTYDENAHQWIANDSDSGQAITIQNTYSANSTDAISGKGVADALDDLGDAAQKGVINNIIETGTNANKTSTDLPTTNAITQYIDGKTAGLTGAMHFAGITSSTIEDDSTASAIIVRASPSPYKTVQHR